MGHAGGDGLLGEAVVRLRISVRPCDTVARFGGDEFAIVPPDVCDHAALEHIVLTIIDRFDGCFVLNGKEVIFRVIVDFISVSEIANVEF